MKSGALVLTSLVTLVTGHGYLWQPDSRTKLGFKVRYEEQQGHSSLTNRCTGRRRYLPRV